MLPRQVADDGVDGRFEHESTGRIATYQRWLRIVHVQAEQVLANVKAALESVGSSVAQLVQGRVYVVDVENWASFNQIYARWAGDAKPARAVVPVPQLHYGFKVEVEVMAVV